MRTRLPLLLCLLASCSPPEFTHPLTPASAATIDAALLGTWIDSEDGRLRLEISRRSARVMTIHLPARKGSASQTFEAHVTALGAMKVLNLRPVAGEIVADSFLFARYEIDAEGALTVWVMRDRAFRDAVEHGRLKGRKSGGSPSSLIITDTPKNVIRYLETQKPEELWEQLARFQKV